MKQLHPWPLYLSCTGTLPVSLLSCVGFPWGSGVPEERNPDLPPAGPPFHGLLSTSPCTAALPSGAFSLPLSLFFFSCVFTQILSFCFVFFLLLDTQVWAQQCTQCSEHSFRATADSRFSLRHTQTTGRQAHLFLSGDESPTCDSIKSVHRTVHINNGYLFCLIFFSCAQRNHQTVDSFI